MIYSKTEHYFTSNIIIIYDSKKKMQIYGCNNFTSWYYITLNIILHQLNFTVIFILATGLFVTVHLLLFKEFFPGHDFLSRN